jgi:hypothetical protein
MREQNKASSFLIQSSNYPTQFASTLPKPHKPTLFPKLCQRAYKAPAYFENYLINLLMLRNNTQTTHIDNN